MMRTMMMNPRWSTLLVICVVSLSALESTAQLLRRDSVTQQGERLSMYLGGYVGAHGNLHMAQFGALPGVPNCCTSFGSTLSLGLAGGVSLDIPLSESLEIQNRLGYAGMSATLRSSQQIGNEPVLTDGPIPVEERRAIMVDHTLDAGLAIIALEPSLAVRVGSGLLLSAGVRAGFLLQKTFDQRETLVQPEGYTFSNGSTVRNAAAGDIPDAQAIQLHGSVGVGYEFTLRSGALVRPELRAYVPALAVTSVDWRVVSVQAGVSVRFGVYTPVEAAKEYDTVFVRDTIYAEKAGLAAPRITLQNRVEDEDVQRRGDVEYHTITIKERYLRETPRSFSPGITSQLMARRDDGTMGPLEAIRVEELDVIESYPLLPQIYYPEGSGDMASTTQRRIAAPDALAFQPTKLERNQLDVYRNVLNIIGHRMSTIPDGKITVSGYCSNAGVEQGNRDISRQRAEGIKEYLVKTWGIAPERIVTRAGLLPAEPANPTTVDGRAENQRVEIETGNPAFLEPVEFRDRDLIINPKTVVVRPTVRDEQGIDEWSLRVSQNGRQLAADDGGGSPRDVTWSVETSETKLQRDGSVIATYRVRDAAGSSVTASDTVAVDYVTLQTMKARQEEGKMVERYSLIVFDFNSARLNPSNQRIMQRVKDRIQPTSKVRIMGFADRQGNPEYNRELARKRCVEAQRALGLSDDRVVIEPVGSDRLLYDNETPEGRSYSRTVQIEVVTPVR